MFKFYWVLVLNSWWIKRKKPLRRISLTSKLWKKSKSFFINCCWCLECFFEEWMTWKNRQKLKSRNKKAVIPSEIWMKSGKRWIFYAFISFSAKNRNSSRTNQRYYKGLWRPKISCYTIVVRTAPEKTFCCEVLFSWNISQNKDFIVSPFTCEWL